MMFNDFYRGKRVLVTGNCGFKGAWMSRWLLRLGAEVHGLSISQSPSNLLYNQLSLGESIMVWHCDVRDAEKVSSIIQEIQPDVIMHLAAQPLVRESYRDPVGTFAINVMGTVNLLQGLVGLNHPCSVVIVTSDKCYLNREWDFAYRENDALGGHDPYSASKASVEIVAASYRKSFFGTAESSVRIATARAGNVIGGGDWAADRIIPDCIRSLDSGKPVPVRNRFARRPWQHVLEPLSGYMLLASKLYDQMSSGSGQPSNFDAFNFGPGPESNRTVAELVEEIFLYWSGSWQDFSPAEAPHEAGRLDLSIEKAEIILGWSPVWNFAECVKATVQWYADCRKSLSRPDASEKVEEKVMGDIQDYERAAEYKGLAWAK